MKINSIIDLVKDLDTSRQTKNLNKLLIRILLHLQVEFSMSFKLSIGRTAITSEDLYTNEAIMAFAGFDEKKFNIDFLHFLIANKNWLLGAKQAVKGQTLNKESIGNAKIIIPPIEAQEEFASIYNQADKSEYYN